MFTGGDETEEGRQQKSEIVKCSEDIIASEKVNSVPRESQFKDSEEGNTFEGSYMLCMEALGYFIS